MISDDSACDLLADDWTFYKTLDVSLWEKRDSLVGNGQCVPLVQEATGAPGPAHDLWRKGRSSRTTSVFQREPR